MPLFLLGRFDFQRHALPPELLLPKAVKIFDGCITGKLLDFMHIMMNIAMLVNIRLLKGETFKYKLVPLCIKLLSSGYFSSFAKPTTLRRSCSGLLWIPGTSRNALPFCTFHLTLLPERICLIPVKSHSSQGFHYFVC